MMRPYSPSPRWLPVPGIGFPQNVSVGPNVLDPEDFRDWAFAERRRTDNQHDAPAQMIDFDRFASIILAMAFGPLVRWLRARRPAAACRSAIVDFEAIGA